MQAAIYVPYSSHGILIPSGSFAMVSEVSGNGHSERGGFPSEFFEKWLPSDARRKQAPNVHMSSWLSWWLSCANCAALQTSSHWVSAQHRARRCPIDTPPPEGRNEFVFVLGIDV